MLSPQAIVKGLVKRLISNTAINPDSANNDVAVRMFPYGEVCTQPIVRKHHNLCDEGSYFVANNGQSGLAVNQGTSFSATAAVLSLYNGNTATGQGQNLYFDYCSLVATVAETAASAGVSTNLAVTIDNINRYSSGGTVLTPVNPNMGQPSNASGVSVVAGAITATAASAAARTIVGIRNIRPAVSGTVLNVIGDTWMLGFGGVEYGASGQISITAGVANIIPMSFPPIIVPPGGTALVHMWFNATTPASGNFAPEVGFWVR